MARGNLIGARAGRLTQRCTLKKPVRETTDYGKSAAITYSDVATVWADVEAQAGREVWVGDQPTPVQVYDVTIRRRTDVNQTWRLGWQGKTMEIEQVVDEGPRDAVTRLVCKTIPEVD